MVVEDQTILLVSKVCLVSQVLKLFFYELVAKVVYLVVYPVHLRRVEVLMDVLFSMLLM